MLAYNILKIGSWVAIGGLVGAAVYSAWIALTYWHGIGV